MITETFETFVRELDRQTRRVILARDLVADERDRCARTQSWVPSARRSSWAYELGGVVDAIDALRAAHEALEEAESDEAREEAVEARAAAADAVEEAIEAAEARQRDLAGQVAEAQAAVAIDRLERTAALADDDDEWGEALAELAKRSCWTDGDCGWTLAVRESGVIAVTGWAQGRGVTDQDGDILLGPDFSDVEEHEVTGRVRFVICRDDDGSEEANGVFGSIAEAFAAAEALAEVHGIECWGDAWSVHARWIEVAS